MCRWLAYSGDPVLLDELLYKPKYSPIVQSIRACSGSAVQQTNCHPFRHGRWLWMHNGLLRDFAAVKRELALAVDPELYPEIDGTSARCDQRRPGRAAAVRALVSGYLAYVEVSGHLLGRPRRTLESAIATVNLLGCLAFGVSAVASYVAPTTGDERNLAVVNTFTALGALCFLIGAVLLLPEGARASATGA
jgi:hypothetical protein